MSNTMPGVEPHRDYYELLGLKSTASLDEIRRRYKFLVVAFHPDRFARSADHHALAEQHIKAINEAYRVLSDPQTRARYDVVRLTGTPVAGVAPHMVSPLQRELELARARIHQLEQEIYTLRIQLEVLAADKLALQRQLDEREHEYARTQQELDAEARRLTLQLEQLARERVALDNLLKEQLTQANQKTAQLTQELANRDRLLDNLATNKADWERSSQARYETLAQQVRRLQEELGRRDASLTQQRLAHTHLEERLLRVEREAHQSAQNLVSALHVKQQESESYLQGARSAEDAHQRERRSVRLWQVVALIAILNTLVLLALYMNR